MIGRNRRGGMSLGRVAKKAAVATVVNRVVNNAMDKRMGQSINQGFGRQDENQQQPVMSNICPSCHTGNPQNAKFCLNCGGGFSAKESQQTGQLLNNCSDCQANLSDVSGNFCPYCRSAIR